MVTYVDRGQMVTEGAMTAGKMASLKMLGDLILRIYIERQTDVCVWGFVWVAG